MKSKSIRFAGLQGVRLSVADLGSAGSVFGQQQVEVDNNLAENAIPSSGVGSQELAAH